MYYCWTRSFFSVITENYCPTYSIHYYAESACSHEFWPNMKYVWHLSCPFIAHMFLAINWVMKLLQRKLKPITIYPKQHIPLVENIGLAKATGILFYFNNILLINFLFRSASCGGAPNVSDVYGAALWAADYMLAMASINILRKR